MGILISPFLTNVTGYFRQKELRRKFETSQSGKTSSLKKEENSSVSLAKEVKESPEVKLGDPLGIIAIPKIGLRTIFVEGTTKEMLKGAPGHIQGTALPGEDGNSVISGHRTTYGAFFHRLDELVPGDVVEVILPHQTIIYRVSSQEIVFPNNTEVLKNTPQAILTLTTCYPKYSAKKRLIVKALLSEGR